MLPKTIVLTFVLFGMIRKMNVRVSRIVSLNIIFVIIQVVHKHAHNLKFLSYFSYVLQKLNIKGLSK